MTGKQNLVFWIGLIIILVNFWVTSQSTVIWQTLSGGLIKANTGGTKPSTGKPAGVKPGPGHPDPHGFVQ